MADLRQHALNLTRARYLLFVNNPLWNEGKLLHAPILAIDVVIGADLLRTCSL